VTIKNKKNNVTIMSSEEVITLSKKKIFLLICLFVFTSWSLVSIYYYSQHVVTIEEYNVGKKIEVSEGIVFIRNLTIHNYEVNYDFIYSNIDKHKWFYNSLLPIIPDKFKQTAVKVKAFYGKPYDFDLGTDRREGRIMHINGIYVSTKGNDLSNFKADVYTDYGRNLTMSSSGYRSEGTTNFRAFDSRDKFYLNEYSSTSSDSLIIKIEDPVNVQKHEIIIQPEWKTTKYNFFKNPPRRLSFSPDLVVDRLIREIEFNKDLSAAKQLIHPEINEFPWENFEHNKWSKIRKGTTKYIGEYHEFTDVFSTGITFNDSIDDKNYNQTLYMVDYDGEFRIIDID